MKIKTICLLCAVLCVITATVSGCSCSSGPSENSILGTWVTKSPAFIDAEKSTDEDIPYYYTFEEDGKARVTTGTFSVIGKWFYVDSNGSKTDSLDKKVKIEIQTMLNGTYFAEIKPTPKSKNKFTLKLSDDSGTSMTLTSSELPKTENKVPEGFEQVDYITGKWQAADNSNIVYIFNADGTFEINQTSLAISGTYKVNKKDKIIELTYLDKNQQNALNIPFLVKEHEKGQKITFADSVFTKAG